MSQTCSTEEGRSGCGCTGHKPAMMMLAFVVLAVIFGAVSLFIGK